MSVIKKGPHSELGPRKKGPGLAFQLRVKRAETAKVSTWKRIFRVRGPQEALDYAKQVLGIEGSITPRAFREAGGVFLKQIRGSSGGRGQVIYPF